MSFGKRNWIGHILRKNCLLKHAIAWRKGEEEDVGSYWMTLRISVNIFGLGQKPSPVCSNILS